MCKRDSFLVLPDLAHVVTDSEAVCNGTNSILKKKKNYFTVPVFKDYFFNVIAASQSLYSVVVGL